MRYQRAMVVDDDPDLASLIAQMMGSWGWEAWSFRDPRKALRFMQGKEGERIQVVLSDTNMPYLGGVELLRMIALEHPETIRVLMSARRVEAQMDGTIIHSFLLKPFDEKRVREFFAELIGRNKGKP